MNLIRKKNSYCPYLGLARGDVKNSIPAPKALTRWGRIASPILVVCLFAGVPLAAKDNSSDKRLMRLPTTEEVTVTASRYQEKTAGVVANVSVITEEDIANSTATDIPGLLRSQVNIQVTDIAGNQRFYNVDLRGFGETAPANTLVLVDGRRVNQPSLNGVDWMQIPLERVKRIEIVRGGRGSVLYGDNAGAGVINIITGEEGPPSAEVELSGGSYKTFRSSAQFGSSGPTLRYAASGGYFRGDGYRSNSQSEGGDFGGSLGLRLGDRGNLDFSGGLHTDKTGQPGAILESEFGSGAFREDSLHLDDFVNTDDYYILVRPELRLLDQSTLQFDFSARRRDSTFFSSFIGGTFEGTTETDFYTVSPRLLLQEKIAGLTNSLSVGYDFVDATEDIFNTTVFSGFESPSLFTLKKRNHGLYFYDEVYPLESLALSAGYRYDRATFRFAPSSPDQISHDENLYTAGLNYRFYQDTFLYFGYSRSFRYPVLDEMFNFFGNTVDTNLRPQTGEDLEVGLRHYFTESFFGNLNFFHIDMDNEIFFNPIGGDFGFGANANFEGKTRKKGLELSLGAYAYRTTLRGSYGFTDADVRDGQYQGSGVPGISRHKMTIESQVQLTPKLTAGLSGTYVGKKYFQSDWGNVFGKQDGYFLLNARLRYPLSRATLFLDLNNILNREYSEYGVLGGFPAERAFYPSSKFNARVGVRFSIR